MEGGSQSRCVCVGAQVATGPNGQAGKGLGSATWRQWCSPHQRVACDSLGEMAQGKCCREQGKSLAVGCGGSSQDSSLQNERKELRTRGEPVGVPRSKASAQGNQTL